MAAADEEPVVEAEEEVTFDEAIVGVDLVSIFTSSGRTAWEKNKQKCETGKQEKDKRGQYFFIRLRYVGNR